MFDIKRFENGIVENINEWVEIVNESHLETKELELLDAKLSATIYTLIDARWWLCDEDYENTELGRFKIAIENFQAYASTFDEEMGGHIRDFEYDTGDDDDDE